MWSGFHEAVKVSLLRQSYGGQTKKDRLPVNRDDPFFEIPISATGFIGAVCLLINET
jgi:hypothetical protein